jgi:hypothetical protein
MADEQARMSNYLAEDIVDNIDEVREARGEYDSLDERLDEIEGGGPSPSNPIASNCVSPMTGYSKSSSSTPGNISTDDTLNAAIGKLEKRTELNENNISLIERLNGAKNYIYYAGTTETITTGGANIQATNNGDGTLTIDGTTGSSDVYITITRNSVVPLSLSTGNYVLSGVDTIATNVGIVITPLGAGTQIAALYPPQTSATVNISTTGNYACVVKVVKNTAVDHALIKPMLVDKSIWDGGFVDFKQYAMSNAEITAWILAHS